MNVVPLNHASRNSTSIAYGYHGCVQVFVGCERDYEELKEGFLRILSFQPQHKFMLIKLHASADYACEYVDCGLIKAASAQSSIPGTAPITQHERERAEALNSIGWFGPPITQRELAERRAAQPMKPKTWQKPCDHGLFSDEAKQVDLMDLMGGKNGL